MLLQQHIPVIVFGRSPLSDGCLCECVFGYSLWCVYETRRAKCTYMMHGLFCPTVMDDGVQIWIYYSTDTHVCVLLSECVCKASFSRSVWFGLREINEAESEGTCQGPVSISAQCQAWEWSSDPLLTLVSQRNPSNATQTG